MAFFREIDSRKMRDRDAGSGDRGNGEDLETLTGGTPIPGGVSGTEGHGDQDTGMGSGYGSGYGSGDRMAPGGRTGGSADAGDSANRGDYSPEDDMNASSYGGSRDPGDPLPDSGGPDVSDMGENEPNTAYGNTGADGESTGQATDMDVTIPRKGGPEGANRPDWNEPGVDTGSGMDLTDDTASGGNWGDSTGLSSNAAGPGSGDWISGDADTGVDHG